MVLRAEVQGGLEAVTDGDVVAFSLFDGVLGGRRVVVANKFRFQLRRNPR